MASAAEYEQMMRSALDQVNAMTPVNQSDISREFMNRVDNFRPLYEDLANVEQQAYASPASQMQGFNDQFGYGADARGPSALARMNSIFQNVGQQMGTADVLGNVITTQRGRVEDLAKSANDSYMNQRAAVQDRYNMLSPLYQAAMQREENERSRAAQAAQMAAMYGGYGQDQGGQGGEQAQPGPTGEVSYLNPRSAINAVSAGMRGAIGNTGQSAYINNAANSITSNPFAARGGFNNAFKAIMPSNSANVGGKMLGRLF